MTTKWARLWLAVVIGFAGSSTAAAQLCEGYESIVSDEEFVNTSGLTEAGVQSFLNGRSGVLSSRNLWQSYALAYSSNSYFYDWVMGSGSLARTSSPADIIFWSARDATDPPANVVNPKVLLALLQKEQSLVDRAADGETQARLDIGVGYAPGNSTYRGFVAQVRSAAYQLTQSFQSPPSYVDVYEGVRIYPANAASAALYEYNPSIHGNCNFRSIYESYFGLPNPPTCNVDDPGASFEPSTSPQYTDQDGWFELTARITNCDREKIARVFMVWRLDAGQGETTIVTESIRTGASLPAPGQPFTLRGQFVGQPKWVGFDIETTDGVRTWPKHQGLIQVVPANTALRALPAILSLVMADDPCADGDGDGYGAPGAAECRNGSATDCNDTNANVFPGATEFCNGIDDNCAGGADEPFGGLGQACSAGIGACQDTGVFVCTADGLGTSCDATPGTPGVEGPFGHATCTNALDDDCDGFTDANDSDCAALCTDADGDGYALEGGACGPVDCNDGNPNVNPGAAEIPGNGIDEDCNATTPGGCSPQLADAAVSRAQRPIQVPFDLVLYLVPALALHRMRRRGKQAGRWIAFVTGREPHAAKGRGDGNGDVDS